jgi:3-phytase
MLFMRLLLSVALGMLVAVPIVEIRPALETESAAFDVDDPALWVNTSNPASSLIVGTVKRAIPEGGLAVYNLDGKMVEKVEDIDRPDNVDIHGDICVVTERLKKQLRIYRVGSAKPHLKLLGIVSVFNSEQGERAAPMGVGLYQRPADKALFAIVSRKEGPAENYLWEYRLQINGQKATAEKVREFGAFSGVGEIEAVAVDDNAGLVYYADEDCCLRVYRADPNALNANIEVKRFAESGFMGDREGIAVAGNYVIATDQLATGSEYHVFDRKSLSELAVWRGQAESTDGIEASTQPLGPRFPRGILIAMNNARRNFQFYAWPASER